MESLVCDSELAENFGVSGCQFEDSIEKLMKSVNMLCGTVRSENMLCGTAIANVNLPRTKQHLVGRQLWGALSWIKLADRYMDQIDFWESTCIPGDISRQWVCFNAITWL